MTLATALLLALAQSGADVHAAADSARQELLKCPASAAIAASLPDSDWQPVTSAADAHAKLRADLAIASPESATHITIFGSGGHLETIEYSIILTRSSTGQWAIDAVGRSKIWVDDAKFAPIPSVQRSITANDGKLIDEIISDSCFYAEPSHYDSFDRDEPPPLGIIPRTVEIFIPSQRRIVIVFGDAIGRTGQLLKLIEPYLSKSG